MKLPPIALKEKKFSRLFHTFFSSAYVEAQGRSSGFVQRKGQLSSLAFLSLCVFQSHAHRQCSLEQGCEYLYDHFGIDIRKQSLDERFHARAVDFMRKMLSHLIQESLPSAPKLKDLSFIEAIRITDASGFGLPQSCQEAYPGSGGSASSAQVKLYLDYDLLSGKIEGLSVHPSLQSDASYGQIKAPVQAGELLIDDLGFYNLDYLKSIAEQEAYFLYRYKTQTSIYQKDEQGIYQRADPLELVAQVQQITSFEVAIGRGQLECRLIIEPIPEREYQKRIRKLQKRAKKRGQTLSRERKTLARYNLFITNTSAQVLPDKWIRILYSLRWQIELIFKIFKSIFHIDKIQQMHQHRFECILYGKLIAILLSWNIFFLARQYATKAIGETHIELSEWKGFQLIKQKFEQLKKVITQGPKTIWLTICQMIQRLIKRAKKEKKNIPKAPTKTKKMTPFDILYQIQHDFEQNKIHNSLEMNLLQKLA